MKKKEEKAWCRDEQYAFISDLDGKQARLFDLQEDPKQCNNVADKQLDICEKMYRRILKDSNGFIPHYDTRREGHEGRR